MSDLDLLRDLGERLDPHSPPPADRLRARIVSDLRAERRRPAWLPRISGRRTGGSPAALTARRALWVTPLGAAAATAALIAGGVITVPGRPAGPDMSAAPGGSARAGGSASPGGPATSQDATASSAPAVLDARGILLAAASRARTAPSGVPDPAAFVYTRSKEVGYSFEYREQDKPPVVRRFEGEREAWLSVDGTRDGAVTPSGSSELRRIPGCPAGSGGTGAAGGGKGGGSRDKASQGASDECPPRPAYRPDVPDDVDGALALLRRDGLSGEQVSDAVAFTNARDLLQESLLEPGSRAAVFEAIARLRGVDVVPGSTTVAGRVGVAVGVINRYRLRAEIVFDPDTHEVIGVRDTTLVAVDGVAAGTTLFTNAVLEVGVVDAVRVRPDGTSRSGQIR